MTSIQIHTAKKEGAKTPCRVLVVDDNKDAATTMALMLELQGHTVRFVTSPLEAIAAARELKPHVVLLDIGMPVLNGFSIAMQLRSEMGTGVHIVAVSGFADPDTRARAIAAGFNAHFEKPADTMMIQAAVRRACSRLAQR